tara:strand:+ start:34 stop:993 length:960 start_codon:yes stop_codon:yes gene_type:complete
MEQSKLKTKILITGAAGYVGKNLVLFLRKNKKFQLKLIDYKNKPKINFFKKLNYIKHDLNINLKKKLIKINPDIIIHLAALTSVTESEKFKKKYYKNNFVVTKNICSYCKQFNKKLIFASSAGVYKSKNVSIKEDDIKKPKNYYGKTKLLSEKIITNQLNSKSSYIILRFFNIGGGDKKNKLIFSKNNYPVFKMITNIIKNKSKFFIFGKNPKNDKTAIRDYIHVFDVITIIKYSLNHLIKEKKNLILNCCNGIPTTIIQLIKMFEKISKKKINYEIVNKRKGEDFVFFGSNQKLKKIFNFKPKYSLKNIVKDTYESIN